MDVSRLIMMVNQIEKNISFAGEKPNVIGIHLKKFWTPQMRSDLYEETKKNPTAFSSDVISALQLLHSEAKA